MPGTVKDPTKTITERQLELIALYASGHPLAEIAEMKFLSPYTVRNNLAVARERIGARSLTHLCIMCLDAGMLRKNGVGYKPVLEERVVGE